MNIVTLLQKQERTKKDINQLIECLGCVKFLNQLKHGQKLYQATLRGFAEKATLIRYDRGHIIWREGIKQEKLFVILKGSVKEYIQLDDDQINLKRSQLILHYPECQNLLTNKPGRRIVYEYENEHTELIKATINDNMRRRRSMVFEIPSMMEIPIARSSSVITKNLQSLQTITINEAPLSYMLVLSKEVKDCLDGVRLINDYHLQYFIQDFVLSVKQGRTFYNGELLNTDLSKKKFENTLLCLEETMIMQISLEDYHNIDIHMQQRKQQKIWDLIYDGLFGKNKVNQDDVNQIMKVLVQKYMVKKYTQYNIVYVPREQQRFLYIIKEGEFQFSFDNQDESVLQQTEVIAKVSQGCLLGEESYSIGKYLFKCSSISAKNKLVCLSISDLEALTHRFIWFRDLLKNKEKIKLQWLKTRMSENKNFNSKLNEKLQTFEVERKIINQLILPDQGVQIHQFQRLKTRQPQNHNITPSPLRRPQLIRQQSQNNIKTSNSQKPKKNLNIFGNEILCELGIGKIGTQNTKVTNQDPTEHSLTYRDTSRMLLKRVQRITNQQQQPLTQRDNSTMTDLDVVPMMMSMNKSQLQFLKTAVGRFNYKSNIDYTNQEITPVIIQSILPKRIVRRTGYD